MSIKIRWCKCVKRSLREGSDSDPNPRPPHPAKIVELWLDYAPISIQRVIYSGNFVSTLQRHVIAFVIGLVCGLLATIYQFLMQFLLWFLWTYLPNTLSAAGVWNYLPSYWWNFSMQVFTGLFTDIALFLFSQTTLFKGGPGTVSQTMEALHSEGTQPGRFFLPMWLLSVVTIAGGAPLGPEAPVVIMFGAVGSWMGSQLTNKITYRRIFTLAGTSAGLAAFFGLPLGATLFALELPHSMSLQYYEAMLPSIVASLGSVVVQQIIMNRGVFGNQTFAFAQMELTGIAFLWAALCGVVSGLGGIGIVLGLKAVKWVRVKLNFNPIFQATLAGLILGGLSILSPEAMFWGEYEVPFVISANNSSVVPPFVAYPGVLGAFDATQAWEWGLVAGVKTLMIYTAVGGGFPGGIVYPLFFLGALLGKLFCVLMGIEPAYQSLWILCMMAGLQGSVTRTPWGTVLLVLGLHGWEQTAENNLTIFPAILFTAMFVALAVSYPFPLYKQQHGRRDLRPSRASKPHPKKAPALTPTMNENSPLIQKRKDEVEPIYEPGYDDEAVDPTALPDPEKGKDQ